MAKKREAKQSKKSKSEPRKVASSQPETYPGPKPGSAIFVNWPPGEKLGILVGYTSGDEPKPKVRIAAVDPKGAYTGEMGAPRTFELHDVLGVAVCLRGVSEEAPIASVVANVNAKDPDRFVKELPIAAARTVARHAEIRDRLEKAQAEVDAFNLAGVIADEYKLALTCTCAECSADVGEFCVKKMGRGRNMRLVPDRSGAHRIRIEQAEKAAALIANEMAKRGTMADGAKSNAEMLDRIGKAAERERAKVERQGDKAARAATGAPANATKPGPVDRAVASAVKSSGPLDDLASVDSAIRVAQRELDELSMSVEPEEQTPAFKEEVDRLIERVTDLKLRRHELAKAAKPALVHEPATKEPTMRQREVNAAKAAKGKLVECAWRGGGQCKHTTNQSHASGRWIDFGTATNPDARWFCDAHVAAGEAWEEASREECAKAHCTSYFRVRDIGGHPVHEKPEIVNSPDHWWTCEEEDAELIRVHYCPAHKRDGEERSKDYEKQKRTDKAMGPGFTERMKLDDVTSELAQDMPPPFDDEPFVVDEAEPW